MAKARDSRRGGKGAVWGNHLHAGYDAKIDAKAAEDWEHPADAMEGEQTPPPALSPGDSAIFRALIDLVVPPAHYGRMRRWEAGHHRLVVMVYVIAPEYFPGMSREDLGRALGLCPRALAKQFAAVHAALASAAQNRAKITP